MAEALWECQICLTSTGNIFSLLNCSHNFCRCCLSAYSSVSIEESRLDPPCPMPNCPQTIHPNDIEQLIPTELICKWENRQIRKALLPELNARWCPSEHCHYVLCAVEFENCPKIACGFPGCNMEFCYHCRLKWHEGTVCVNSLPYEYDTGTKLCPNCGVPIFKQSGCNQVSCTICGCKFCWICTKDLTTDQYHHYTNGSCQLYSSYCWPTRFSVKLLITTLLWLLLPLLIAFDSVMLTLMAPIITTWFIVDRYHWYSKPFRCCLIFVLSLPATVVLIPLLLVVTFVGTAAFVCGFLPLVWLRQ